MKRLLKNPILPGFYPDPSICRKGEDYYLVTSTFEYFPGIPIFHSRDFVHWHQVGHALSRPSQLNLDNINPSKGIYASSIFYSEKRNRFYIITTLVGNAPYWDNVNFYVYAEAPEGPWSEPIVIEGAVGIDPSIVFDGEDVYYLGNCRPNPDQIGPQGRHIWMQALNLETGEFFGERHVLRTQGALAEAAAPEGPHIYHIGEWYYLLIAEGGTSHNHSCTIFRSRIITGPYEGNPRNPLITHRNLKRSYPVNSTGHADLVQLHNGEWWAVLLASRPVGGDYRNLGRETFAVPVIWEEGWPVFSPETGHVEFSYPAPELLQCIWPEEPVCDQFEKTELSHCWITVRTPRQKNYSLAEREGVLRLYLNPNSICEVNNCSFVGRRQQHLCFSARTSMEFKPNKESERSGLVLLMNHNYHIRLEYVMVKGNREILLTKRFAGCDTILAKVPWEKSKTYFKVTAYEQDFSFYYAEESEKWNILAEHVDGYLLSKEVAGGYTGTIIGMYASSNGTESDAYADFHWFEYQGILN